MHGDMVNGSMNMMNVSGFIKTFNRENFKEVLLYILENWKGKERLDEDDIYCVLYFIDFDFYEKYEDFLLGFNYKK